MKKTMNELGPKYPHQMPIGIKGYRWVRVFEVRVRKSQGGTVADAKANFGVKGKRAC